jgi:NAD-dependent deacetylase
VSDIAALAALLRAARYAVVFTGAGISTESGIPDFRSPPEINGGGIWTKMQPIAFQDYLADPEARRESWRRRFAMEDTWKTVQPNAGHKAVTELVVRGIVREVVTQNIDALHQASGIPEEQVVELHGNTMRAGCLNCGARVEIAAIRDHFERHGDAPDCVFCGGLLKTATISFGQPMPAAEMARAEAAALASDLFLVLGSSLSVFPAAGFPLGARRNGAQLAIVNREPTPQDHLANLVVNAEIGPTMTAVIETL